NLLGKDKIGIDIKLKDIWPSDEKIDSVVNSAVIPEMFGKIYYPMFASNCLGVKKTELFYNINTKTK
ncbi:hypothetical protein ACOL3I_11795, partial [Aliarcobacter butzleri]